jgi:hypothetical protein
VNIQLQAPEALSEEKGLYYPLDRWLCGPQKWSERCGEKKVLDATEIQNHITLNIENNQHGGRKDNTIIVTSGQLTISTTSGEAHV